MKKVLSVLVAAIMLAALCVPAFAAGEAVTMTANKTALAVGETVTVTVKVTNLTGVDGTLYYDADCFELVSAKFLGLMGIGYVNPQVTGEVIFNGAETVDLKTGDFAQIVLKYKGGDTELTMEVREALDADDKDHSNEITVKAIKITEAAPTTTKKPADKPADKPAQKPAATTTKAPSKGNVSKVNNPKSGGTVSVAASAAAVVVMAAAVAYTMKKKNED